MTSAHPDAGSAEVQTVSNRVFTVDDSALIAALRAGDEQSFTGLLEHYHPLMLRIARIHVRSVAVAEEVVQETWLAVLEGLHRFEERSSLRTWIFSILLNTSRSCARREGRSIPFSSSGKSHAADEAEASDPPAAVDPDRFYPASSGARAGQWALPPRIWGDGPEEHALTGELRLHLEAAIDSLPPRQREVMTLRDVHGWPAADVCEVVGISDNNQRVLLHRARAGVRRELERYFDGVVS